MIGEVVGSYRVSAKMGEGSTGVVYLAEHTLMGRRAAIKFFASDPGATLLEGAQKAATINHPGLVEIFDSGTHQGSPYMVMEYLDGESVARRVARAGRVPLAEALGIAGQIAATLAVVHEAGVTHAHLTPGNIILVPDAVVTGGERAKLLDTGVASSDPGAAVSEPLAPYAAPEQLESGRRVDHRADLYALGCILFEMLCGQPPFTGDTADDIVKKQLHRAPPSLRELEPTVPEQVESLVLSLLAKNPMERPRSASAVEAAIDRAVGGPSIDSDRAADPGGSNDPVRLSFDSNPWEAARRAETIASASGGQSRRTLILLGALLALLALLAVMALLVADLL